MQWDIYVQCGRHICSGAYANNVKCYIFILVTLFSAYLFLAHICTLLAYANNVKCISLDVNLIFLFFLNVFMSRTMFSKVLMTSFHCVCA